MTDKKLSELPQGLVPKIFYELDDTGLSKQFNAQAVLNVRDFGAKGDNLADDTASIQAAFNAAFGPIDAPNGDANKALNKSLYFPPGKYLVTGTTVAVSGAVNDGGGKIKLTISSLASGRIKNNSFVNVTGLVWSDGGNYGNGRWGVSLIDPTHIVLRASSFPGSGVTWTGGGTVVVPALQWPTAAGAQLYGSGRSSTQIWNNNGTGTTVQTNGLSYSSVRDISFVGGDVAFDWNGDGISGINSQAVTFEQCEFGGTIGLGIGQNGSMCSECLILNCHCTGCPTYGVNVSNFNAAMIGIVGGNFQGNGTGIHVGAGSVPVIHDVSFQEQVNWDIDIINSAQGDTVSIHGCRDERTTNFIRIGNGVCAHIAACNHIPLVNGVFLSYGGGFGGAVVDACYCSSGTVVAGGPVLVQNSAFGNHNPFSAAGPGTLEVKNTKVGGANSFGWQINYKLIRRAMLTSAGWRTYDTEGTSLIDPAVASDSPSFFLNPNYNDTVSFTNGSSDIGVWQNGFIADMAVMFTSDGALPNNFSASTIYYVLPTGLTQTNFKVSATIGGPPIVAGSAGSVGSIGHRVWMLRPFAVGDEILKSNVVAGGAPGWICTAAGYSVPGTGAGTFEALTSSAIINVKDFGAKGDGSDDTIAIQAAFDKAFGPYSNPNQLNGLPCRPVYFPAGGYLVRPRWLPRPITGCVASPSGGFRLTIGTNATDGGSGTTGYTTGDMVYVRNVGGVDHANGSFSCVVIDSTHVDLYANGGSDSAHFPFTGGPYTRGGTICKVAIQSKQVNGVTIRGDGKNATSLGCDIVGVTAISFNGMYKCSIENMAFNSNAGIAFDLNDDGSAPANGISSQSNFFINVQTGGSGSFWNDYGIALGFGQKMCSETVFVHPTINMGSRAGLFWANANALSGIVFGGQFGGVQAYASVTISNANPCVVTRTSHAFWPGDAIKFTTDPQFVPPGGGALPAGIVEGKTYYVTEDAFFITGYPSFHISDNYQHALAGTNLIGTSGPATQPIGVSVQSGPGIYVGAGACPNIHGAAFQNFHGPDIRIGWASNDAYSISGCRSESAYFAEVAAVNSYSFEGCSTTSGFAPGQAIFANGHGNWTFNGCWDAGGHCINNGSGVVVINGSQFDANVLTNGSIDIGGSNPINVKYAEINPRPIKTINAATYSFLSTDPAYKIQFGAACTATVNANNNAAGCRIEIQQTSSGTVTIAAGSGVTIRSRGNRLSLNGQWAVATLSCDAVNSWTLSGDLI